MKILFYLYFLSLFNAMNHCIAQIQSLPFSDPNVTEMEQKLSDIYTKWVECQMHPVCDNFEQLDSDFSKKLSLLLSLNPNATFEHTFQSMISNEIINVFSSEDGNLKIYNWDKFSFTSMRECYSVYQFKSDDKVMTLFGKYDHTKILNQAFLDKITALHTVRIDNKTYYFIIKNSILSSNEITQTIECLTIENGKLTRNVPIFKTKKRQLGSISFNFLRSTLEDPLEEIDAARDAYNLIVYEPEKQRILIPVVNENMEVKTSYLVYQLNGQYFEYKGIQK